MADNYQGPGRYYHYKGGEYEVLGLALREETVVKPGEDPPDEAIVIEVVYKPLTPGSMLGEGAFKLIDFWTRRLEDFNSTVDCHNDDDCAMFACRKCGGTGQQPRFRKIA